MSSQKGLGWSWHSSSSTSFSTYSTTHLSGLEHSLTRRLNKQTSRQADNKTSGQADKQKSQSSSHLLVDEGANVFLHLLVLVPHHPPALLHLLWGANLQTRRGERCLIGLLETFVGVILETVVQVVWGTLAHTSSSFHCTTSLGTVRQTLSTFFRAACLHFFINVTTTT